MGKYIHCKLRLVLLLPDDPIEVFLLTVCSIHLGVADTPLFQTNTPSFVWPAFSRLVPASQWRQMIVFFFLTSSQYFILLHLQELILDIQGFLGKGLQCFEVDLIQLVFSSFKKMGVV